MCFLKEGVIFGNCDYFAGSQIAVLYAVGFLGLVEIGKNAEVFMNEI